MFICEPERLPACMVYALCAFLVPVEVRGGVLFPGTGVTGGYWELILGLLQEHPAVSTTGPSLQPFDPIFFFFVAETFFTWSSLVWLDWWANELQGSICLCRTGAGVPCRFFQVFNVDFVLGMQTQVLLLVQQAFHWLSPLLGHISRISRDAHMLAIWSSVWPVNRTLHI